MNPMLVYAATTFYSCISRSTDEEELVRATFALYDTIGPVDFDKLIENAVHHLAILTAVKNHQKEAKDESVTASQEESPVAGRDHKE